MKNHNKSVLIISSHVIRGAVGARNSAHFLEEMGYPCWEMLTVSMPWQPYHGASHRLIVSSYDFQAWAEDILRSPWRHEIKAVLSGYFAHKDQVVIAANMIKTLLSEQSDLFYLCDPVMADERGLYVHEDIAKNIVDHLLPLSTMVKPNRSELEWIGGKKLKDNQAIQKRLNNWGGKMH
ncbi:bifunctional hydroxymethylpyrimidine kinase/phosphomethylpyrimidine kinase [Bartonella tamiae]|uniref:pyridoxal kinase n=1 Tax=Bartonella tamiae Th239 TaxID=1094558 RepID=J0ZS38_9HYPH|nr:bifunctional hydroxymethylpyrimidine kinase/phosphomethylpyrimidine kinase [Bartonella tamiae]EJF91538.1 pyridoxal kinase [Bartonella tamiae Th239]EJF92478.1 pyridoxal kinase [Bartonella tamiae Th307]